ncbi:hypothetical protein CLV30_101127 [Haloactinopolyspora alba]|uniref:DUF6879 domain-containing protein n=1 Tax=Haloactinopolyspora alba TaxID=648780 RepID=A0A2P8EFD1_9ACTN|nr:DUF6879 family protein [Haloactinopolyspora alba]PSL08160.1 hypothetical protein CLV30_101127 [Haloactinopolyspora alba]
MAGLITGDAFTDLFREFAHTAYRLEVRRAYDTEADDTLPRFLAGEEPDLPWFQPWLDLMVEQTGQGKRVERVRVVDDPPSDYLRFEMWLNPHNQAAGEDIRYLHRHTAAQLGLPGYDYWLFDSRILAKLEFDDDGDRFLGVTLDDTPTEVVTHNYWRDAAWHYAETFDTYQQRISAAAR